MLPAVCFLQLWNLEVLPVSAAVAASAAVKSTSTTVKSAATAVKSAGATAETSTSVEPA